ncbi:MAG TPA: peptidylprolyl isomerase, partial [Pirellulales bacterium]|nr:peptidylprolyl isomerase [Pirellulales bacterium]
MFERFFAFKTSRRPSRDLHAPRRRATRLAAPACERRMERLEDRLALSADTFLTINTTYGAFQVELYDSVTPQTVSNFMHYVNTNSFADSIFHRSVPGFVLQGGGYTTSSATFSSTSQFTAIPNQGTIASEAGIPNSVGTLSMALSAGPDSATSQWFINLADNSSLDDSSAGGPYTVFGKVIGAGMQVVDAMAALPTQNQGVNFTNLPVDPAHGNQLAEITTIAVDAGITGEVFNDVNVSGGFDPGEVGLPGQTVYIDANNNGVLDNGEVSTTTDAFGQYGFGALTPGSYVVREVVPANHGLTVTTPAGAGATVNVLANTTVSGPNFGDVPVSTVAPLPVSSAPLPSSPDGNTAYIQAVYLDVLGHAADAAGLAAWQAAMEGGVSRAAVAQAIWGSLEHRGMEVDQYYQTFFGRQADAGGRAFWITEFSLGNDER